MKAPIDDARVRIWIREIRALAFALPVALVAAIAVHAIHEIALEPFVWFEDTPPAPPADPRHAWVVAGLTFVLASWAARGGRPRWRPVWRVAIAGAVNGPAALVAFAATDALVLGGTFGTRVLAATCFAIPATVFGGLLGIGLGWLLEWLHAALDRFGRRPTLTAVPRAIATAALSSALLLGVAIAIGGQLAGARELATALVVLSFGAAVVASLVALGRNGFVLDVERGAMPGWRVERDEDGTRWLVREERGGERAYREGVMSRRWARV